MMGVLILLTLVGVLVGLVVLAIRNEEDRLPARPMPTVRTETTAARLNRTARQAETEMLNLVFQGYAEMMEEARQARIARLLEERSLR